MSSRKGWFALMVLVGAAVQPALAQESGGVRVGGPLGMLNTIQANQGCPLSTTTIGTAMNKTTALGSVASQQVGAQGATTPGCRPLVSTQVGVGTNLAIGRRSVADQTLSVQGPRGALGTTTFTRGVNMGVGAGSMANQRILNVTGP